MIFATTLPRRFRLKSWRGGTFTIHERSLVMNVRRIYADMRRHGITTQGARLAVLDLMIVGRFAGSPTARKAAAA